MQTTHFRNEEAKVKKLLAAGKYFEAMKIFDMLMSANYINTTSYFTNVTGMNYNFNFLMNHVPDDFEWYNNYLALPAVREAIHVGNLTYNDGMKADKFLINDIMTSVMPWVGPLFDNYRTLIYCSQLDIIVAAPLTESFLRTVKWKGADAYRKANKLIWRVAHDDPEMAGYVRQVGDFYQVIVRNAGRNLPYDQPRVAYDMIKRFINGNGFEH